MLSEGQRNDINFAIPVLEHINIEGSSVLADRGYDSYKEGIASLSEFADPVVKGSGMNALLPAPLIVGESALAAFHDKFDLFWFSYTVRIHNDCFLKAE